MNPSNSLLLLLPLLAWSSNISAATDLRLSAPLDYQVHQRTTTNGSITVAGLAPVPDGAQLEVLLSSNDLESKWRPLATTESGPAGFRGRFEAPAGGWYRLEVRARRGDETVAHAVVEHVGIGEVFVVTGQSNSANHGDERQQPKSGLVAALASGRWQIAHDPQPGASGSAGSFLPPFGDAMVERFKVPVGLVAAGVGATSVREWLPRDTRFPNPPTLTGNVSQLENGEWSSKGTLFNGLVQRMKSLGPRGFRAVLWHQGESDANQTDKTRTLAGPLYEKHLALLIRESRRAIGWDAPWFVAQASYHTPEDPASPEIRAAQAALWSSGIALQGPDTDALDGAFRDGGGKGVHFSGAGLREHGARWAQKVAPWLEQQLSSPPKRRATNPATRLDLPGAESFTVAERPAFLYLPPPEKRSQPQPWIFYAPTLPGLPDRAERWMHEQFLAAGVAVAGVDVGEAYGSPKSHPVFDALYRELTEKRQFAPKPCLFGRSRGGLWVSSWAIAHPERVAGLIGIYPVFDFRTYPSVGKAAPAYALSVEELTARADEFNPIARVDALARARIPVVLIHGDVDTVVPLRENSAELVRRYEAAGAGALVKLITLKGQGHNFYEGFFHSSELVTFAIERAQAGR